MEYNITLLGSGAVGKSALSCRFVEGSFLARYAPTIEDSYRKIAKIDEKTYSLEILDTIGSENFSSLREMSMKRGDGFVLVFSITCSQSLVHAQNFYQRLKQIKGEATPCVLVGNKADLNASRTVSVEEGMRAASYIDARYIECSAEKDVNVNQIFVEIVRRINDSSLRNEKKFKAKKGCSLL